jgi:hypothetical protein
MQNAKAKANHPSASLRAGSGHKVHAKGTKENAMQNAKTKAKANHPSASLRAGSGHKVRTKGTRENAMQNASNKFRISLEGPLKKIQLSPAALLMLRNVSGWGSNFPSDTKKMCAF